MADPVRRAAPGAGRKSSRKGGDSGKPLRLTIPTESWIRSIFAFCVVTEVLFFVLDYHVNYGRATEIGAVRRLFNTAREDSLPSWFGTAQTSLVALTLWAVWLATRSREGSRWRARGWLVLAAFFTYLTADDGSQIHERMGTAFEHLRLGPWQRVLGVFPSYTWQVVYMPAFSAMGAFLLVFVWRQAPERSSRVLLLAALGCLAFAVGLDFFEGLDDDHPWNPYTRLVEARPELAEWAFGRFRRQPFDAYRHFSKSLEETVEMFAYTLFWVVFLRQLAHVAPRVDLRLEPGRPG